MQQSQMNARAEPDQAEIEARIRELGPWFHNLELHGTKTAPDHPLGDYPAVKWRRFSDALAPQVVGRSVLDIGCNGGFHAIEIKKLGAARVVAIDHDERYLAQARFAADVSGLEIEFHHMSVYDVASLGQRFDVVLFMGVLYHLRHPLLALDLIHHHVASDLFVFQSMQRGSETVATVEHDYDFWESDHFNAPDYPKMHFVEHRYAGDWTNWWVPNRACAEAMLRSSGFSIESHPEAEVYICRRVAAPKGSEPIYPARG